MNPGHTPRLASSAVEATTARAWHREPMVWLVIAFPLAAVLGGFATLYLAIVSWDGLVVDDYYKQGLEINKTLARDHRAAALGLSEHLMVDERTVRVELTRSTPGALPAQLQLSFLHATRSGFDQQVVANGDGHGLYTSTIAPLAKGHWLVHIEADDWRLRDQLHR